MSLLGAAAITGGASLLGSIFNVGSQSNTNKANKELAAQQNEYNLQLQDRAFRHNVSQANTEYERALEQWYRESEYNSPSSQIARYQAAGLNPNLIYGTGSASAGNVSTSTPKYTAAKYEASRAERANLTAPQINFDPYQAIQFGQALSLQKAQRDNISAQTSYTEQQTANAAVNELLKTAELTGLKISNRQKEALFDLSIDQARANLSKTRQETSNLTQQFHNLDKQYGLTEAQTYKVLQEIKNLRQSYDIDQYRNNLLRIGITDRDGLWTRLGSRILLETSGNWSQFYQDVTNALKH